DKTPAPPETATAETKPAAAEKAAEEPAAPKGGEVSDHIDFKSVGGKELPQSLALREAKNQRGPSTFGRTGGSFGRTVDQTHGVLRQYTSEPTEEGGITYRTDANGTQWAKSPDSPAEVSIPKGITGDEASAYAQTKLDLQTQFAASRATVAAPQIQVEGPAWDRTHSAIVNGQKVGSVGYKLDPTGRAQIYGSN